MKPPLESHYNRRMALSMVGVGVFLLGVSGFVKLGGFRLGMARLVGAACLPVGGWMLLDRRVKLRIDEVGIRYSRWGDLTIPWGELQGAEIRTVRNAQHVQLLPRPEFDLHARVPLFWRMVGATMKPLGLDEFSIAAGALEHGVEQVLAAIRDHLAVR